MPRRRWRVWRRPPAFEVSSLFPSSRLSRRWRNCWCLASSVGVTRAVAEKKDVVACASTGNAASSLAGLAAAAGIRSVIFIPEFAPEPKVAQLLVFGELRWRDPRGGREEGRGGLREYRECRVVAGGFGGGRRHSKCHLYSRVRA